MAASFSSLQPSRIRSTGAALIMTLIVLSVLLILLTGFLSSMLLERRAATSYEDTMRAKIIAEGAVSHAIDLLRSNIPEPARLSESPLTAPGENWIVNPGRLTVIRDNGVQTIPLHTGEVTTGPLPGNPRDADSVDLNQPLPGQTTPAITGTFSGVGTSRPPMRVRWVNLFRDQSQAPGPNNRLTGRYAFWMDDECSRVNFNLAVGKPDATSGTFGQQVSGGFVTPTFSLGDSSIVYSGTGSRDWALGRPQSVNLDSFFSSPSQLKVNELLAHSFLHGFARYPEAIMDFVNVSSPRDWYEQNRYGLTFYNRSPEFNAFGKSRLFTSYVPLSLEGGPSYQQPFIYDPTNSFTGSSAEVLHLNSMLGTFGFTSSVADDDGSGTTVGGNVVNRAQLDMLLNYMRRKWPGYSASFVDKYGEDQCTQIALNAILMARMATTAIGTDLTNFSNDWAFRSTSVNYAPDSDELPGNTPERFYWRFPRANNKTKLMLPQMPGPFITEVLLHAQSVPVGTPPKNDATQLAGYTLPRYIQYWYEVEYYMPPGGPVVDLAQFPTRMDYFEMTAAGGGRNKHLQFGPADPTDLRAARNWNTAGNLGRLATSLVPGAVGNALGPVGSSFPGQEVKERRIIRSNIITVGQRETAVPYIDNSTANPDYTNWDPLVFDAAKSANANLTILFRPGMSTLNAPGRPRQMIPLGETSADTLQAVIPVGLVLTNDKSEKVVSWQINDPRLSSDLAQWTVNKEGPGLSTAIGTPGLRNKNEPAEDSAEKSKARYIERAPTAAQFGGLAMDRPDEYATSSRVSSPGYWSLLHTGMQLVPTVNPNDTPAAVPWRTLNFGAATSQNAPPDWLLLDLFGATFPMTSDQWKIDARLPDEFSTASFMNSTAGQVNLNSRIYPQNDYFKAPERTQPLAAVFTNLRSQSEVNALVQQISSYQKNGYFGYVGELANMPGIAGSATNPWQAESLLRNMAGVLTTKSNTFGVWGVAQVVQKVPKNQQADRFENGDQIMAEKRFYALVERYIWAGRDGVPGNGHLNGGGRWDRLAQQTADITTTAGITDNLFQLPGSPPLIRNGTQPRLNLDPTGTYPVFDGPERVGMNPYTAAALGNVQYRASSLEDADNPPQPAIKYRVVYFKYLDQ